MLKAFALMFVMVGLAQAEVKTLACSPTKEVQVIDMPGEYVLIEDCAVERDGISINASDVQLNLDGHTISGPGCDVRPEHPTGITVFGSNVHVTGGTVKGFQGGVQVRTLSGSADRSADHNQLSHLTVTENCTGIELRLSNNNRLNFNNVSGNFLAGVVIDQGSDNQVNFNVINENGSRDDDPTLKGRGILLEKADSNVIAFNAISRNEEAGVNLLAGQTDEPVGPGSNNNTIAGNIVTETALDGIRVDVGNNNTIHGNLSSDNERGIVLGKRARGNFVLRNTALGNERFDLADLTKNCDNNKWRRNIFKTDSEDNGPRKGCIR